MGANDTLEQLRAAQAYAVELEALNAGLAAVIEQAPHAGYCNSLRRRSMPGAHCQCWKSRIDTDAALREIRAAAFEEAAGYFGENQMTREGDVKEWLRNKAAAIREGRG